MSSRKRPSKNSLPPAPFYADPDHTDPYCHTCGRVISHRKSNNNSNNIIKYCSDGCRAKKPGAIDRKIEETIIALLDGRFERDGHSTHQCQTKKSSSAQRLVSCDEVERIIFRPNADEPNFDRTMDTTEVLVPQTGDVLLLRNEVQTPGDNSAPSAVIDKQKQGQQRAEEREMVRRAARRGVVFGFIVNEEDENVTRTTQQHRNPTSDRNNQDTQRRRRCEAVQHGMVVEPSFAKGDWSLRWRE